MMSNGRVHFPPRLWCLFFKRDGAVPERPRSCGSTAGGVLRSSRAPPPPPHPRATSAAVGQRSVALTALHTPKLIAPVSPPRGKSGATNTAPARKQIGCPMTAVIFETLSLKSAANRRRKLYGHQAAPLRAAGRAIPGVLLGNGLRSGWDWLIARSGKICADVSGRSGFQLVASSSERG